ncbi:MAG: hypothetical protein H6Q15_1364 [Bacteroidetes bacterium]|nr:hypothetical protein [Bacteroidota bacterium]
MFFPLIFCLEIVGWGLVWGRGIIDWVAWIKEIGLLSLRGSVSIIKREYDYLFNLFCVVFEMRFLNQKLNYIHNNPVKKELVNLPH